MVVAVVVVHDTTADQTRDMAAAAVVDTVQGMTADQIHAQTRATTSMARLRHKIMDMGGLDRLHRKIMDDHL